MMWTYKVIGAVVSKMSSGWVEKMEKKMPPAAWAKMPFLMVRKPFVVRWLTFPKPMVGNKQAKYRELLGRQK